MKNSIKLLMFLCVMFLFASNSFATSYIANLTGSYRDAWHSTPAWQELSTDTSDFGVFWSVDGGATWGNDDLYVGQTVTFMVSVHKDNLGTHNMDLSKTWLDWGQDGVFNDTDVIEYGTQVLTAGLMDFVFYSDSYKITDEYIGDLYLRSRVTCSESLTSRLGGNWNDQWNSYYVNQFEDGFSAIGGYNQGEVEEWLITVNAAPVPEPATLFLLGSGLLGFAGSRRKKK